jgi:hypothetical protein
MVHIAQYSFSYYLSTVTENLNTTVTRIFQIFLSKATLVTCRDSLEFWEMTDSLCQYRVDNVHCPA